MSNEQVKHPDHYNKHPSGIECWDVVRHMNFNLGSAVKYIWRADEKHETPLVDLQKAVEYLQDEIKRLSVGASEKPATEYDTYIAALRRAGRDYQVSETGDGGDIVYTRHGPAMYFNGAGAHTEQDALLSGALEELKRRADNIA